MFVLAFDVAYEGLSLLGVYSSLESAVAAAERYAVGRQDWLVRDLVVLRYEADAAAALESGDVVWSYA